jgi:hypothetical protein
MGRFCFSFDDFQILSSGCISSANAMNVVTFKEFNVESCIIFVIKSVRNFRLVSLYRPLFSWKEVFSSVPRTRGLDISCRTFSRIEPSLDDTGDDADARRCFIVTIDCGTKNLCRHR